MKRPFSNSAGQRSKRARVAGAALALPLAVCVACVDVDSRQVLPAELGSSGSSSTQGGASGGSQGRGGASSVGGAAHSGGPGVGGHGGAVAGGAGGLASGGAAQGGATGVCLKLKGDATALLIDDLDDQDLEIAQQGQRVGYWFTYNDATNCSEKPLPMSQFLPVMGGANGTVASANMNGSGCTLWGAGMGFDLNRGNGVPQGLNCPYDLGPYTGITFFAKSVTSTSFNVLLPLLTTESVALGGKCMPTTVSCDDHYQKNITNVSPTWTQYKVFFSELKQYGFGVPTSFDPTQVIGLRFETPAGSSVTVPYDLSVDQLNFF